MTLVCDGGNTVREDKTAFSAAKIVPFEDLDWRIGPMRAGRKLVQCHGCFDVVHPGHIRYLNFARNQGDLLLVSVTADGAVNKGAARPYFSEQLRAENLAALECVDLVVIDPHDTALSILDRVRPDIYIKGKEYEKLSDPRFVREKEFVESYGGSVIYGSGDVVFSSTELLLQRGADNDFELTRLRHYTQRHRISPASLHALFEAASSHSVVVVGDPLLDRYVHCERASVASEGPILSVSPVSEEHYAGGAALIAATLAGFGLDVTLVTTSSRDPHFDTFATLVRNQGVQLELLETPRRPTFVKQRFLVDERKLLKVDHGHATPLSSTEIDALRSLLDRVQKGRDALLCTDFGYGIFGLRIAEHVKQLAERVGAKFFVDVSTNGHSNLLKFGGPTLAAPTEAELRFALADQEAGLSNLASRYYHETGAKGLCVTMGSKGALYFAPPASLSAPRLETAYLPALARHAIDPVGAGDQFLSGLVLAELAGASRQEGMYAASCLAALACSSLGNEPVSRGALEQYVNRRPELGPE